jgi:hypothetical protein
MGNKRRSHQPLAALAAHQHGVVSATQLAGLGYSRATIARSVKAGHLHQIHRHAYAVGHLSLTQHGQCLAAVLACGDGTLLSHRSAAWLWGITARWEPCIEVTATSPRHARFNMQVHSAEALAAEDRGSVDGIPTTSAPRTLLDFAAVDPYFLKAALERCSQRGLLDLIALDALIARSRGFRGVARLRSALEAYRTTVFTRSRLERRFLELIQGSDLPRPSINLFIEGYELDAYWPVERFAVELDTYDHHGSPVAFEADRLRQEDLKLAGIEMTRVTGARIDREPEAVVIRLRRLLAQRRQEMNSARRHPPR